MADLSNLYANKELTTQQNVPDNHTLIYGTTSYGPVEEVNGAWTWEIGGPATNGIARMRYNVRTNNPESSPQRCLSYWHQGNSAELDYNTLR